MAGAVRKASLGDVDEIGHIHYEAHVQTYSGVFPERVIESFPASERAKMWTRFLTANVGELWVSELEGHIVGFASTGPPRALGVVDQSALAGLERARAKLAATFTGIVQDRSVHLATGLPAADAATGPVVKAPTVKAASDPRDIVAATLVIDTLNNADGAVKGRPCYRTMNEEVR